MEEQKKPTFEHVTCGRCGGSGNYSFNLMHGSKCYGCGGSGYKLTKRGRAAQKYLDALRSRPAGDIKVGDLIQFDMFFYACFARVTKVEIWQSGRISIYGVRQKTGETMCIVFEVDSQVRMGWSAEEKVEQVKLALAYQESLTKNGEVSKRKSQL